MYVTETKANIFNHKIIAVPFKAAVEEQLLNVLVR